MPVTKLIEEYVDRLNRVRLIVGLGERDVHNLSWIDVGEILEHVDTNLSYARFSYGDTSPEVRLLMQIKDDLMVLRQELD